jgi:hypothetical protein
MTGFATLTSSRTRRGRNEQASAWTGAVEGLPAIHARLQRVAILNRPALDAIRSQDGPETLHYLDPPYLHETRTARQAYGRFEMTEGDHRELLGVLLAVRGKVMLSGYPSALYDEALRGWRRLTFDLPNNAAGGQEKSRETGRRRGGGRRRLFRARLRSAEGRQRRAGILAGNPHEARRGQVPGRELRQLHALGHQDQPALAQAVLPEVGQHAQQLLLLREAQAGALGQDQHAERLRGQGQHGVQQLVLEQGQHRPELPAVVLPHYLREVPEGAGAVELVSSAGPALRVDGVDDEAHGAEDRDRFGLLRHGTPPAWAGDDDTPAC